MVSSKLAQHKGNELGSDGKCVQELLNIHGTEQDLSPKRCVLTRLQSNKAVILAVLVSFRLRSFKTIAGQYSQHTTKHFFLPLRHILLEYHVSSKLRTGDATDQNKMLKVFIARQSKPPAESIFVHFENLAEGSFCEVVSVGKELLLKADVIESKRQRGNVTGKRIKVQDCFARDTGIN